MINPNTTLTMTRGIEASAKRVCRSDTEIIARSPAGGVASIEGNADGIAAAYHMLSLIRELTAAQSIDGIVIARFDDTGLHAARELVDYPVIGIGEAAAHAASLISARFSVLTSLQRSVTILERNAIANGWSGHNFSIHASGLPVLDLESDSAYSTLLDKARSVVARDHAECLVLGCGGMSHWTARLSEDLSVPVTVGLIDSTFAAVVGAFTFITATIGINIVANFVSAAFDFSNIAPRRISWRAGGMLAACGAVFITPWNLFNSPAVIHYTLDVLASFIGPLFGILVIDFYLVKKQKVVIDDLYSESPTGAYYFDKGVNWLAIKALVPGVVVGLVMSFLPGFMENPGPFKDLANFAWFIGVVVGGLTYRIIAVKAPQPAALKVVGGAAE